MIYRWHLKFTTLTWLAFAPLSTFAQCNCLENLQYAISSVETNYIGYQEKTVDRKRELDRLTKNTVQAARKETRRSGCLALLNTWLGFFEDPHLVMRINSLNLDTIRNVLSDEKKMNLSLETFNAYLEKAPLAPMEGVWVSAEGSDRLGIIKQKSEYVGFILSADSVYWMPGQIRMKLTSSSRGLSGFVFDRHRTPIKVNAQLSQGPVGTMLDLDRGGLWYKLPAQAIHAATSFKIPSTKAEFRKINEQTAYLRFPSFASSYKKAIDSLFTHHDTVLRRTPLLIVDIRNNLGGTIRAFDKLLPLLYTRPILKEGGYVFSTEKTIRLYEQDLRDYLTVNDERGQKARNNLHALREGIGTQIPLFKDTLIHFDAVSPHPQRIALLINQNTASSAEFLMQRVKQSGKATVFGRPTMGGVDFVDVLADEGMPCALFYLRYPMTKTTRLYKDPKAPARLKPDVDIPDQELDWVEYVVEYFQKIPQLPTSK